MLTAILTTLFVFMLKMVGLFIVGGFLLKLLTSIVTMVLAPIFRPLFSRGVLFTIFVAMPLVFFTASIVAPFIAMPLTIGLIKVFFG